MHVHSDDFCPRCKEPRRFKGEHSDPLLCERCNGVLETLQKEIPPTLREAQYLIREIKEAAKPYLPQAVSIRSRLWLAFRRITEAAVARDAQRNEALEGIAKAVTELHKDYGEMINKVTDRSSAKVNLIEAMDRFKRIDRNMIRGESQGLCDTTQTERFYMPGCRCETYKDNLGPCRTFEKGDSGRCAFCDHELNCHTELLSLAKVPA